MSDKVKPFVIAKKWLEFAEEDAKTVDILWNSDFRLFRTICFHAQQYVEKIIKGIIEGAGQYPPRIHDINTLSKLCENLNVQLPLNKNEILFLSSVYIDTRYPPDVGILPDGEPTKDDARIANNAVAKMIKWLEQGPSKQ
jgi:HEPN domain-containing protein